MGGGVRIKLLLKRGGHLRFSSLRASFLARSWRRGGGGPFRTCNAFCFPFSINNNRSISFIEQGKQCLYITSKLKVWIEISVLLKGFIEVRVKGNVSLHSFICTCEKALTLLKIDLAFNFCHQMTKKGVFDYLGDVHKLILYEKRQLKWNWIDLVTVFDAILTSRQTREKLEC